jgi:hypothetical protein
LNPRVHNYSLFLNALPQLTASRLTRTTWASTLKQNVRTQLIQGAPVNESVATRQTHRAARHYTRIGNRQKVRLAGRLTWRDATGALRFVSVMTRDVSDVDVFVECQVPASIPLYRLVHFQIERPARECGDLPPVLQQGKVLSAVYRVGAYKASTGTPHGYALRLLVEPKRNPLARTREQLARAN